MRTAGLGLKPSPKALTQTLQTSPMAGSYSCCKPFFTILQVHHAAQSFPALTLHPRIPSQQPSLIQTDWENCFVQRGNASDI